MHDDPSTATRKKKDSSMTVALTMLKNGEGDAVEHVVVGAAGQVQFADGLLRQHGRRVVFFKHANVPRAGKAEPVAHAHGAVVIQNGHGRGEREQRAKPVRRLVRKLVHLLREIVLALADQRVAVARSIM